MSNWRRWRVSDVIKDCDHVRRYSHLHTHARTHTHTHYAADLAIQCLYRNILSTLVDPCYQLAAVNWASYLCQWHIVITPFCWFVRWFVCLSRSLWFLENCKSYFREIYHKFLLIGQGQRSRSNTFTLTLIHPASKWMHWATLRRHSGLFRASNSKALLLVISDDVTSTTVERFTCAWPGVVRVTAGQATRCCCSAVVFVTSWGFISW